MLSILSHQGNTNQNYFEIPSYTCGMAMIKNTRDDSCWRGCGTGEHSSIASESRNLYSHCENQYDSSSKNWELIYLKTQFYHSRAYTQRTLSYHKGTCSTMFTGVLFIIARN